MNGSRNFVYVLLALSLLLGLFYCSKTKIEKELQIGAILPLTGNFAKIGIPKKNAMEIAAEEINNSKNKSSKKMEIIYEDSKGTSKDGVTIFQKMLSTTEIKTNLMN